MNNLNYVIGVLFFICAAIYYDKNNYAFIGFNVCGAIWLLQGFTIEIRGLG